MRAQPTELDRLLCNIRACRTCVEAPEGKPLPHEPRPVLRVSPTARLAVCSQAPGTRVHASGIPFTDASGDRLRDWMGVGPQEFYDESRLAIIPMGFCFPGQDANGADLPPRAECAKTWHPSLFARLPQCSPSGPIRSVGILGTRRGTACRRPCSSGASICGGRRGPASFRFLIPPGATMRG